MTSTPNEAGADATVYQGQSKRRAHEELKRRVIERITDTVASGTAGADI